MGVVTLLNSSIFSCLVRIVQSFFSEDSEVLQHVEWILQLLALLGLTFYARLKMLADSVKEF